jgi:hypothetical protein
MFDWDEANIAHIAAHSVLPHEAEEVIENQPVYLDYSIEDGEERHREMGETLQVEYSLSSALSEMNAREWSRPMSQVDHCF